MKTAIPATLSKSQIADLYSSDLRTIHRALDTMKANFPYWFTKRKQLFPREYKPILEYLEEMQGFEKSRDFSELMRAS